MSPVPVPPRAVSRWVFALFLLVGLMVAVGGITRLTGSGLSITEWRPIMGALPPMDDTEWQHAFDLYRQTPQFLKTNSGMSLAEFQGIFFWEYFHRLLGRLLGVVFLVPYLYFLARGRLRGAWARRAFVAFALGGLQGALGWFMVASGLVDVPRVSHFRLAAHLSLAFFVSQYLLWLWLDLRQARLGATEGPVETGPRVRLLRWFIALVGVQIVYGALMAGSRAGYLFQTFPDLNGAWVILGDYLNDPVAIHFMHRLLGWLVAAFGLHLAWTMRATGQGRWLGALVAAQFVLGVATVMTGVQVALAIAHQLGALGLLSVSVCCLHAQGRGRGRNPARDVTASCST